MSNRIRIQKICKTCKKQFEVHAYRKNTAKYCSIECMNIGLKDRHISPNTEFKKGRIPHNYKGIYLGYCGRYLFACKGKIQYAYRYLIEKVIKRKLKSSEHVHHKDNNKLNDLLENFMIFSNGGHRKFHYETYNYLVDKNLVEDYIKWFKNKYGKIWKYVWELIKGGDANDR